jgi:hypothetical protein
MGRILSIALFIVAFHFLLRSLRQNAPFAFQSAPLCISNSNVEGLPCEFMRYTDGVEIVDCRLRLNFSGLGLSSTRRISRHIAEPSRFAGLLIKSTRIGRPLIPDSHETIVASDATRDNTLSFESLESCI